MSSRNEHPRARGKRTGVQSRGSGAGQGTRLHSDAQQSRRAEEEGTPRLRRGDRWRALPGGSLTCLHRPFEKLTGCIPSSSIAASVSRGSATPGWITRSAVTLLSTSPPSPRSSSNAPPLMTYAIRERARCRLLDQVEHSAIRFRRLHAEESRPRQRPRLVSRSQPRCSPAPLFRRPSPSARTAS